VERSTRNGPDVQTGSLSFDQEDSFAKATRHGEHRVVPCRSGWQGVNPVSRLCKVGCGPLVEWRQFPQRLEPCQQNTLGMIIDLFAIQRFVVSPLNMHAFQGRTATIPSNTVAN